ncbi:helix-turn-helix domain-containing protein [Mariniphaga sediminis]|uniref:Helix-turn-helix domain-containing protein n=1 Tax=Mariniphaga sediminis TaxID=1628158 RepID=A0A399CVJ8_9BACT|nr:helix-turn-helix domain-containing protein [Mariniphaga sediminis]RIH63256.1 helix-turn-helix domain-containing protein [Mariniphaga sediminis]
MNLSANIKFLRKRRRLTQSGLAEVLGINRSGVNNYENGAAVPPLNILIGLSDLFHISIDTLLRIDLSTLRESQLYLIENGSDVFVKGNELRVLATTVDSKNRDNIELVSIKAKAGYTTGFFDPEYISGLPVFHLPFLSKERKYRTFQVSGDSMLPITDKCWVTGEYVQNLEEIKDDGLYIVLTLNEGIVFKKVRNELKEKGTLRMISTNPEYAPYDLPLAEIREVWKFIHFISSEVPEVTTTEQLFRQIESVKKELEEMKKKL